MALKNNIFNQDLSTLLKGKKDTDFSRTSQVKEDDIVAIVQNKENKSISLKDLMNEIVRLATPTMGGEFYVHCDVPDYKVSVYDYSDENVKFMFEHVIRGGKEYSGVTVDNNCKVTLSVSAPNYESKQISQIINGHNVYYTDVTLNKTQERASLTVGPTPSDAVVLLNGEKKNYIEVLPGDSVEVIVYKEGYQTSDGQDRFVQTVTLTNTSETTVLKPVLIVKGEGVKVKSYGNPYIVVTEDSEYPMTEIPKSGGTVKLQVCYTVEYTNGTVETKTAEAVWDKTNEPFLDYEGNGVFTFKENSLEEDRNLSVTANIYFPIECSVSATIVQKGQASILDILPNKLNYDEEEREKDIKVKSSSDWTINN